MTGPALAAAALGVINIALIVLFLVDRVSVSKASLQSKYSVFQHSHVQYGLF